ncbi:MAG TPA: hypothetical protein VNR37_09240 [Microbacteriaceae bacterium]|nr:hypothetical protein [Microbacteriaceae bacterium]
MRKRNRLLIGASLGLAIGLGLAAPAFAMASGSGHKHCPGGASAVSLTSSATGADLTHWIGSQIWSWSDTAVHYSVSNYTDANWTAATIYSFSSGPTPYCT